MKNTKCKAKQRITDVFFISKYMVKKYGVQEALDRILARKLKQQPKAYLADETYTITFKAPTLKSLPENLKKNIR